MAGKRRLIIFSILVSTTGCISLWFAGNAVFEDLRAALMLPYAALGAITSAVHFGFIAGTFLFAYWAVSDRFPARIVYFACALSGAAANLLILLAPGLVALILIRFFTGFMLAGIYPVGMKIASSWYREDTGKVFGFLLGAFTLGTASPHLLRSMGSHPDWRWVIGSVSLLALSGGLIMLFCVPDGPHLPRKAKLSRHAFLLVFKSRETRAAALGYFGHMWELYTFWVLLPYFIMEFARVNRISGTNVSLWTFMIIAGGCAGCIGGGLLSARFGSARIASIQLSISGLCCLLSPFFITEGLLFGSFVAFLFIWGIVVVGDSPQFSSLVARYSDKSAVGTSLTLMNCIGFSISIVSIELISRLVSVVGADYMFLFLVPGPLLGLVALGPLLVPVASGLRRFGRPG